ncbi:MAG TPA: hypothetical protein VGI00_24175 [Streptosporangiaceae bacterium]
MHLAVAAQHAIAGHADRAVVPVVPVRLAVADAHGHVPSQRGHPVQQRVVRLERGRQRLQLRMAQVIQVTAQGRVRQDQQRGPGRTGVGDDLRHPVQIEVQVAAEVGRGRGEPGDGHAAATGAPSVAVSARTGAAPTGV